MKQLAAVVIALALASSVMATGLLDLQPSVYRDARYGALSQSTNLSGIQYSVQLPPGRHAAFTVLAWMRVKTPNNDSMLTTSAFWCPDPIRYANPDLLSGAGGWGTSSGTNLTTLGGSITVASFPFSGYTNTDVAGNPWPRGVYTLAGWASNTVTVGLGGTDVTLGPGEFTRNAIPGPANSVVISGSGLVSIGISKTPCHRFFDEIDGVVVGALLSRESCVTNELSLCVWRFRADGTNQVYRSDIGRVNAIQVMSSVRTNALPGGAFDSGGIYRIGLKGAFACAPYDVDLFDVRVFPWYLSDQELERIHYNGVEEIARRGIPQWR